MTPERQASCAEALDRARNPRSIINMTLVMEAAARRGIADAVPGGNVLTFKAWIALGRCVRKGETALVKLPVFYTRDKEEDGKTVTITRPGTSAVFHISQTDVLPS